MEALYTLNSPRVVSFNRGQRHFRATDPEGFRSLGRHPILSRLSLKP